MKRRVKPEDDPVYYVSFEDTYDAIKHAPVATDHEERGRMAKEINKKYANITQDVMNLSQVIL